MRAIVHCIVALIASGLASATAHAQAVAGGAGQASRRAAEASVTFGVEAGVGVARVGGDDVPDEVVNRRTVFSVGGFASFRVHELVALRPELLFVTKGAEIDVGDGLMGTIALQYLQLPMLVSVSVPTDAPVAPHFVAGPAFGVLLSSKAKVYGVTEDARDETKPIDVGLVVGAGLTADTRSGKLAAELRYEHGLTTVDGAANPIDMRNRVLTLLVGYAF